MNIRQGLILGNGEPPSRALFERLMADRPVLLCADGGADIAVRYGWTPDYVIGDLDSVAGSIRAQLPPERLVRVDADNTGTDLQKALHQTCMLGLAGATLTGATGRRTDHTLWNLGLLKMFGDRLQLRMVDDFCEIRLIKRQIRFQAAIGQIISLCPLGGPVAGIQTQGLRFPLRREILGSGIRDGISNEVVANPVEVDVEEGDLLLVVQRQEGMEEIVWEEG